MLTVYIRANVRGTIDTAIADWRSAGLLKPSVLKPIFTTVEKGLIIKKLGRLGGQDRSAPKTMLQTILGE